MPVYRVEIATVPELPDALAAETKQRCEAWLGLSPRRVQCRSVYHLDLDIDSAQAQQVAEALTDPIAERGAVGMLDDGDLRDPPCIVTVGFRPGVTDSVGASVKRAAEDCLGRRLSGVVYSSTMFLFWGLTREQLEAHAGKLLYNAVIERATFETVPRVLSLDVPAAGADIPPVCRSVPIREASDETLLRLSREGVLALNLTEMRAIAQHFAEQGRDPTDAELECLAQTWSEHCKHKIFSAPIDVVDADGTARQIDDGLFRRFIRGATTAVAEHRKRQRIDAEGQEFLVSVFHDNAGVVRFTDEDHLVYKVETHNSPSALDPYGGAMTGIVGVNRDSFGTGLGADLLTNVWGYCFADPAYDRKVPAGLMHPRRIRDGVHRGVIDGGNQSGIPYSRGFELFDDRFLGKPLVFCGTVAVMPAQTAGRPTHEKPIAVGDHVVMLGGRIGKDGIHGATFSSVELDESSPVQAVQIGDPITQKMMFDMLGEARDRGLMSGMTDNGAGGLSSSVGEMAEATGGARIDLAKAPVKYPGLAPWEILISEAQERMTVAVRPEHLEAFLDLARRREVEASVLGTFTDTGRFEVSYNEMTVVDLSLEFLHEGLPKTRLRAVHAPPRSNLPSYVPGSSFDRDDALTGRLLELIAAPNQVSAEQLKRHYDHEVKGLSVIKPLVGVDGDIPATATVMRVRHLRNEGVVLGEGVHPYLSDLDAHAMALACVDEGVRRVLCAGARYDRLAALDNFCWPDPVRSATTPDGEGKLYKLVACCEGLRAACEAFGLPLISGKDSMKNDATLDGVKISIPPTLLVSVMGQLTDVRSSLDLVPRVVGDHLYILGPTADELGASEVLRRAGKWATTVPQTDLAAAADRYASFAHARDSGLVRSAHVVSRGGLAVALCHLLLSTHLGLEVDLDAMAGELSSFAALFSESTGRLVFTAPPEHTADLVRALEPVGLVRLGTIAETGGGLQIRRDGTTIVSLARQTVRDHFTGSSAFSRAPSA